MDKKNEKLERLLPQDTDAEAAVLSAMFIDGTAVSLALELLKEEDFYKNAHRQIFRAMRMLFEGQKEIDLITVRNKLELNGHLEEAGGVLYLNEISDLVLSGANMRYHAELVQEKALLRQLITASNQIIDTCFNTAKPAKEVVDIAEQKIFEVADHPSRVGFQSISGLIQQSVMDIEQAVLNKAIVLNIGSGFPELDRLTGGFKKGHLVIIAARPAMGKTAFALNIAATAAVEHDKKVAVFTLEMPSEEIIYRMIGSAAQVNVGNVLKGYGLSDDQFNRIAQVGVVLGEKSIYIDDAGLLTVLDIKAKCRRLKAELKGLDLVIIDYMQLMDAGARKTDNRQQEISDISRGLKALAKELEVPVIALSQLNRRLEDRINKRPQLSDLRESGAIEQDADLVMFLYRDEYYHPAGSEHPSEKPGTAEVIIGKNRHGPTGTVELRFVPDFTLFQSLDTIHGEF